MLIKLTKILFFIISSLFLSNIILAQDSSKVKNNNTGKNQNRKFVDKDGDGYNDNAPDHDVDGIPNGLDADYIKFKKRKHLKYTDADGDGINDNLMFTGKHRNRMKYNNGMNLKSQDGSHIKNSGGKQKGKGHGNGKGRGGG